MRPNREAKHKRPVPRGLPSKPVRLAGVPSSRDDRVYYSIYLHPNGKYTCNCPVGLSGAFCKHIEQAIVRTLVFSGTDAEFKYKLPLGG